MHASDDKGDSINVFELLSSCSSHLGVAGLARVAASSTQLNDTCITIARRDVQSFLQPALQQATAFAGGVEQEQHLQALLWLLQAARAAVAAASVSEQLVRLPDLSHRWALQLVAAGVNVTYQQLLAAACSMVPGVEVWVQVQQQLGVQTDVPATAVAVCCGEIAGGALDAMSPSHLDPTDTADILQIAVNCSSQGVAAAAIDRLVFIQRSAHFSDLEPEAVCRILVTAALRQHASVIESLASQPGVEEAVDPHTLEKIFKHLISCHEDTCTALLDEWPAAVQTLSADAVARLILHALESGPQHTHDRGFAAELMRTPAAAQISSDTLADIITASILQHDTELVAVACEALPAQQITHEVVAQLQQAALQQGSGVSVMFLCSLPAAQQLSSSEMFGLLRLAVQQSRDPPKISSEDAGAANELSNDDCMMQLLLLPAAFQVTSNEVARLLQAAVQLGSSGWIDALSKLPAAGQLGSGVVGPLLLAAVQQQHVGSVPQLCQHLCTLPGAQQLRTDTVVHLLRTAVANDRLIGVQDVCGLPAAKEISSEVLAQLLQAAVRRGQGGVGALCALPAAQKLNSDCLVQLLQADMQNSDSNIRFFCRPPGVQQLRRSPKGRQLLQAAEQQQLCSGLWGIMQT